MATTPKVRLTYGDYLRLPDDGLRHEIVDGGDYMSPAPLIRHQRVLAALLVALRSFLAVHPLGEVLPAPVDVVLSPHDVVQPDLLFISVARAAIVTEKSVLGPPDLVVEILSPSTRALDEESKLRRYELFGVTEYWLVDPASREAAVFRLELGRYRDPERLKSNDRLTTPLLPGLDIPLASIFP